jgi:hypothetical protein
MVGQESLLQMSLREVARRLSSRTNCLMCSYFQMFVSICCGRSIILSILAESFPALIAYATYQFLDVLLHS